MYDRQLKFKRNIFLIFVFMLVLNLSISVQAGDYEEQQGLVDKARITFQNFMRDENMSWLQENLHEAKGILIIPSLLKGGFILGGSGGSGVLIVRDPETGNWSQPGFYTIGSVTFGLQIGGEAAEVIMFVRTKNGLEKLYASSLKLGGDTSIAVGPVGVGAKVDVTADILSFTRTKGAYAGVSLEGAIIKVRDKWNENYYGQPARPVDIFVKKSVSNPESQELLKAVMRAE